MNNRKHFILFLLFLFIIDVSGYATSRAELDSLLRVLDRTIEQEDSYTEIRTSNIKQLEEAARQSRSWTLEERCHLNERLFELYYAYQCDSSLVYLERNLEIARQTGNKQAVAWITIKQSHIYTSLGIYTVSQEMMESIRPKESNQETLTAYYETYAYIYKNMASYAKNMEYLNLYLAKSKAYTDSLQALLPEEAPLRMQYEEEKARDSHDYERALKLNDSRLLYTKLGTVDYATIAFERSLVYEMQDMQDERLKYLILSAISDIQSSIKDNASLAIIAQFMLETGDLKRAYRYISQSMDDAIQFNTPFRKMQLSSVLRIIESSYQEQIAEQQQRLTLTLWACFLLLLLTLVALFFIYRQLVYRRLLNGRLHDANRQLSRLKDKLLESNYVKEQYISLFLSMCSKNIDKLENYRQLIYSKVNNKQYKELYDIVHSTDFMKQEAEEFYDNFDAAFCNIYPNFVEEFNKLLREEDRIVLKNGKMLTPELRIFALIRLGISDSADIARLLRYSIRTIYNYRVKMRKKTLVAGEDFEKKVKKIDYYQREGI